MNRYQVNLRCFNPEYRFSDFFYAETAEVAEAEAIEVYGAKVVNVILVEENVPDWGDEPGDNMTDVEADADTLRNAGWGTDEDYGYYGDGE